MGLRDSEVFKKAAEIEGNVEAELKTMYQERASAFKKMNAIMGSVALSKLKETIKSFNEENINQEVVDEYVARLNEMDDLMKAVKIYDRAIITLETGYDPEEKEVMATDMPFGIYEDEK